MDMLCSVAIYRKLKLQTLYSTNLIKLSYTTAKKKTKLRCLMRRSFFYYCELLLYVPISLRIFFFFFDQ